MKRKILKELFSNDYVLSLFSKVSIILFGFITLIFLNRFLGADLKGQYSSIINIVTIVTTVLQLGLSTIYPYFKRKNIDDCYEIFMSLSIIQFIIYSLFSFIVIVITGFNSVITYICLLSVVSTIATQFRYINLVENIKKNTIIVFIASFINSLLTVLSFIFLQRSLFIALMIYVIKDLVIIVMYAMRIKYSKIFTRRHIKYHIRIIAEGILPMLSGLLIMLNYKIDVVMLNAFSVDFGAIGIYSLGLSMAEYIWIIPDIFKDVVQKRTATDNSLSTVNFSLRCSSSFVLVTFLILSILNKQLFVLLFGEEYAEAFNITMILFAGIYSIIYYKIIGRLFISDGKSKQYFLTLLSGVIINIITNYIVIPSYGIYGAAIASVASYSGTGILFLLLYLKSYHVNIREVLFVRKSDFRKLKSFFKRNM